MACSNIPKYLHYNPTEKKIYDQSQFKWFHRLYRTGFKNTPNRNPIEFPYTSTSISVSWSKLILAKDVLLAVKHGSENPENLGNHVYYGRVNKVSQFRLKHVNSNNGVYQGDHILTPVILHKPESCNYAHSEILIKHAYRYNSEERVDILTHENWSKSVFKKYKKGHLEKSFFKELELDYRTNIMMLLQNDIDESFVSKYFPKKIQKVIIIVYSWFSLMKNLN